jgi:hypothetical protein
VRGKLLKAHRFTATVYIGASRCRQHKGRRLHRKIKGGNIATAADSLVQEITAERGDFGRSRDHKPNIDLAGGLYEFSTVEFRIQKYAKFSHADGSPRAGAA